MGDFKSKFAERNKKRKALRKKGYEDNDKGDSKYGKPSPLSFRMKYWSPSPELTRVRLGRYSPEDPFFTYYQAWTGAEGRKRPVLCNCRDGEYNVPCVPCWRAEQKEDPDLLPNKKYVITASLLESFHKVKKQSKRKNKKGEYNQYTVYERCAGTNRLGKSICDNCDNDEELVFGNKRHWSMGNGHRESLEEQLAEIGEHCGGCKDGYAQVYAYACTGCGHVIANIKEDEDLPEEALVMLAEEKVECDECGHEDYAEGLIECVHQEGVGSSATYVAGCDNPKLIDPWECDLWVKTQGTGSSTAVIIEHWDLPKETEAPDWVFERFDFNYFFRCMPLEEQAKLMGIENPYVENLQEYLDEFFRNKDEAQVAEAYEE